MTAGRRRPARLASLPPRLAALPERGAARSVLPKRKSARERGYDWRWQKARRAFLAAHPLCAPCERLGRLTPAAEVDHIVPHHGDMALFWDRANWQPICRPCHESKSAREQSR
jgi:5-methylcytosine-specific restriction endonuclease McrA